MPNRCVAAVLVLAFAVLLPAGAWAGDDLPDLTTVEGVKKALGSDDGSVRLAAARAAFSMQDKKLTAPLVKLAKDDELPIREAAIDALVAREDKKERKAAAKGLAALLKPLTREPSGEDIAREDLLVPALHDLAQPIGIKKLLDVHTLSPAEQVKARLKAVANVPSKEAIEALIAFGSRGRRGGGHRGHAAQALQYATGLRIGNDPDKWREWWRDNEKTFDLQAAYAARRENEQARADKQARAEEKRKKREERRKNRKKPEGEGDG